MLEPIKFNKPSSGVVSTSTGSALAVDADLKELLAQQIRRPVRFVEAVKHAAASEPAMWVEVGPGGVLTSFVRNILGEDSSQCLPTDLAGEDSFHLLNQVLARSFVLGFPVVAEKVFAHRFHRPFDVENYNPVFIVNPCERPVELATPIEPLALSGSGNGDNEFLREFAALYQKHHVANPSLGVPASVGPGRLNAGIQTAKPEPGQSLVISAAMETKDETKNRDALLTFAIDWIAKRTGFPKSAIGPDKKLRDDLNLDSIKVGELVVLMSRKLKRALKGDPASVANASLNQLVDVLLADSEAQVGQTNAAGERQIDLQLTAEATVKRLEATVAKSLVHSPIDGVVLTRHAHPGEMADVGTKLVTIANTNRVRIEAEVDEFDVGRVALGQPVRITAEGFPGKHWRGVVEEVPDAVSEKALKPLDPARPSDARVLRVKIAFSEPTPLKLGQRVEIEMSQR